MLSRALLSLLLTGCAATVAPIRAPLQGRDPFSAPAVSVVHDRQLNFGAGLRSFDDQGFGRLDDPVALALDYCEPMDLESLRLEGGLHYTYDEGDGSSGGQALRLKGQTLELSAGVNYSYLVGRLRPYVGLGASLLFLNLRGVDEQGALFDDDDAAVGGYAKGGLLFQVARNAHVGIEFRHLEGGEVTLDGTDLDTSYDQFLLVFGTSLGPERSPSPLRIPR